MKFIVTDMKSRKLLMFPMRGWEGAYMGPGDSMGFGYSIDVDAGYRSYDRLWAMEQIAEERALSCMYEGGEFCGLWSDMLADGEDETPCWAWTLLPETQEERDHIEQVIVPYGRAVKTGDDIERQRANYRCAAGHARSIDLEAGREDQADSESA